jgi:1-acyl-sn-glycerol-3-phosphate acyltransferase
MSMSDGPSMEHAARQLAQTNGSVSSNGKPGVVRGIAAMVAEQVARAIPSADLDQRDADYIRETLPGLWLLASFYFRADVRGLENIPADGPVLIVGNHSGGNVTPDTLVFTLAFNTYFGVERRFYQLAHNLVMAMPQSRIANLRKYGTVAASRENATQALDSGAALLVYPGGDYEVHRPSWDSAKVDWAGRKGWIRLALEKNVPVVPLLSLGGQETALFLSRGERLARLLRLDKMFRLKVLPISIAIPWGLNVGDMLGHWPLPAKLTMKALPAIDLRKEFGRDPDVDEVYESVLGRMQAGLDSMAAERQLPVVG